MKTFFTAIMATLAFSAAPAGAGGDWNNAGIDWRSYEAGLAEAKETGKPVCLVFYTEWCPHCERYSSVFHSEDVVKAAKKFVMIRIERDANRELSAKYAPDGEYIPRTYFLTAAGELREDVDAGREKYRYFYSTADPKSLLGGMREALGDGAEG